jgi:hypothetical protein
MSVPCSRARQCLEANTHPPHMDTLTGALKGAGQAVGKGAGGIASGIGHGVQGIVGSLPGSTNDATRDSQTEPVTEAESHKAGNDTTITSALTGNESVGLVVVRDTYSSARHQRSYRELLRHSLRLRQKALPSHAMPPKKVQPLVKRY